jgi:dimethylamine monooxygenase subunit B
VTDTELVVRAIDDGIPGVRTLVLARPDGASLPSFTPGSHIVIDCNGVLNAYSLTGEGVRPDTYVVSVLECPAGTFGVFLLGVRRALRVYKT